MIYLNFNHETFIKSNNRSIVKMYIQDVFLLLGCVNIPDTWFIFKDPIESWHKVLGMGTYSYLMIPSLSSVLL